MVSNYQISECHNSAGNGDDMVWYNIEICDMTKEQLDAIMKVVKPMYEESRKVEELEFEKWQETHVLGGER
jgi:hypothetical protein